MKSALLAALLATFLIRPALAHADVVFNGQVDPGMSPFVDSYLEANTVLPGCGTWADWGWRGKDIDLPGEVPLENGWFHVSTQTRDHLKGDPLNICGVKIVAVTLGITTDGGKNTFDFSFNPYQTPTMALSDLHDVYCTRDLSRCSANDPSGPPIDVDTFYAGIPGFKDGRNYTFNVNFHFTGPGL